MPLPTNAELFFGLKLTDEQMTYANSVYDNLFTGVNAASGTGKTTIAVGVAKILGMELHYIFPTVEEGALGFTAGSLKAKERKYLDPLYDALEAIGENPMKAIIYDDPEEQQWSNTLRNENIPVPGRKKTNNKPKQQGWVKAYSHNYMRGSNKKNVVAIIDEAQNLTKSELRKVLTRFHDSCHVVVIGHDGQIDLKNKSLSGFIPCLNHFKGYDNVGVFTLTENFRGWLSRHADKEW